MGTAVQARQGKPPNRALAWAPEEMVMIVPVRPPAVMPRAAA
jgi:hypothetical protein